ncbi:MAG: hypothetical protein ABFS34_03505 [Gemmatimonadota bacterium]
MKRGTGEVDPHLDLKIGLFFVAAALGVGGMFFGKTILVYLAILAIGIGLLLRFLPARGSRASDDPGQPPGEAGPD